MTCSNAQKLEFTLRKRLSRFINSRPKWRDQLDDVLLKFHDLADSVYLCGGAIREFLLNDAFQPRDIDLIVEDVDLKDLKGLFPVENVQINRFGGLTVVWQNWKIDVWPVSCTMAFTHKVFSNYDIDDYTKSTFLNLDAVAVQLFSTPGKKRKLYENGFFDAILTKTIEVNFEESPFPELCIVRSLQLARKYRFAIGPMLAEYISNRLEETNLKELEKVDRSRSLAPHFDLERYAAYIETIGKQLTDNKEQSVQIDFTSYDDMRFPETNSLFFNRL